MNHRLTLFVLSIVQTYKLEAMILNTTHLNKKVRRIINEYIGNEFSFFERIKLKGIGSYKMMILDSSENIKDKLNFFPGVDYCSIELRKKGVMVHFHDVNYEKNSWLIPFYKLVIFKTEVLTIYFDTTFLKLKVDKNFKLNKPFFDKMNTLKMEYTGKNNFN